MAVKIKLSRYRNVVFYLSLPSEGFPVLLPLPWVWELFVSSDTTFVLTYFHSILWNMGDAMEYPNSCLRIEVGTLVRLNSWSAVSVCISWWNRGQTQHPKGGLGQRQIMCRSTGWSKAHIGPLFPLFMTALQGRAMLLQPRR